MDDELASAVISIAMTLKKLEEEGVFTLTPAQVSEALSTLDRIATALELIYSQLLTSG